MPNGYVLVNRLTDVVFEVRRGDELLVLKGLSSRMLEEPLAVEAFDRERRVLQALAGRGAPKLIDAGEDGSGPFFVTADVALPRLGDHCEEGVLPHLFRALAAVHAASDERGPLEVVHGDLSPVNVLADESDARLIDFGLATFRDAPHVQSAAFAGSLRYAAPEQARGEPFGQSADVFSMALSALHALADVERRAPSQAALLMLAAEAPDDLLARAKSHISGSIFDRLAPCLAMDPRARPSARDVFP